MPDPSKINVQVEVENLEQVKELRRELEKIRDLKKEIKDGTVKTKTFFQT